MGYNRGVSMDGDILEYVPKPLTLREVVVRGENAARETKNSWAILSFPSRSFVARNTTSQ